MRKLSLLLVPTICTAIFMLSVAEPEFLDMIGDCTVTLIDRWFGFIN